MEWVGLDWIGLGWFGLDWVGLDYFGPDWMGNGKEREWGKMEVFAFVLSMLCVALAATMMVETITGGMDAQK